MIPLNTPPGTEIVCIKEDVEIPPQYLVRGSVYTILSWQKTIDGPCVNVCELGIIDGWSFDPARFRLLEIHPSLTALLDEAPLELAE